MIRLLLKMAIFGKVKRALRFAEISFILTEPCLYDAMS